MVTPPYPGRPESPTVAILILNWNGWADTLHCLESLLRLQAVKAQIVVCDNASGDGSMERFADWARGRLELVPEPGPLCSLSHPPVAKPVACAGPEFSLASLACSANRPLILLQTGANLGYGGGNNVGIRYALRHLAFDYLWILNNDTLVAPDALDALLRRVTDTDIDICGSTLLFHDRPEVVQCQGGARFYRWLSLTRLLGIRHTRDSMLDQAQVEALLDHPYGAAMLISRRGLDKLGLMPEDYFLYYEEIDWIASAAAPAAGLCPGQCGLSPQRPRGRHRHQTRSAQPPGDLLPGTQSHPLHRAPLPFGAAAGLRFRSRPMLAPSGTWRSASDPDVDACSAWTRTNDR